MALLNIQDDLSATKDLVGCFHLACQSMQSPSIGLRYRRLATPFGTIDEALRDLIDSTDVNAG